VLVGFPPNLSNAASILGGKCTKIGSFVQIGSKIAICKKTRSKAIWTLVTPAQKITYQKQQQQALIASRKVKITDLQNIKEKYSNAINLITPLNTNLIEAKKILIVNARNQLIDLRRQKLEIQQTKTLNQNNLATINNSLSSTQNSINSLSNQISNQQNTVNYAKINNDSSYNSYIFAKAQSDNLYFSSQRAMSDNSAMLTAKVLCDFGFGNCGIYSAAQYNFNLSIISQYNAASARTSSAYDSYLSYNGQYSSALNSLNSLKSQQSQLANSISSLNNLKSQISQNISNADSKIANLDVLISQSLMKFTPLESAEKRIEEDLQKYSVIKGLFEVGITEFIAGIENFLQLSSDAFVSTASIPNWNNKYEVVITLQKDLEFKLTEVNNHALALENFLNTL
jgi:hypothetical protein